MLSGSVRPRSPLPLGPDPTGRSTTAAPVVTLADRCPREAISPSNSSISFSRATIASCSSLSETRSFFFSCGIARAPKLNSSAIVRSLVSHSSRRSANVSFDVYRSMSTAIAASFGSAVGLGFASGGSAGVLRSASGRGESSFTGIWIFGSARSFAQAASFCSPSPSANLAM